MRHPETIVREILANTDLTEPEEIARQALMRATQEERDGFFLYGARQAATNGIRKDRSAAPLPEIQPVQKTAARHGGHVSYKTQAIASQWAAYKRARIVVAGEWKMMGDLTYDDLVAVANERRRQAAEHLAKAEEYDSLAKALRAHRAETVSDLSDMVIASVIGEAS